jgi:hypothetical protein
MILRQCLSVLLPIVYEYYNIILRLKITVEVVLAESEPIIGDPVTQGFELFPYFGVSLLDPGFNVGLTLAAGGGIEPVT